MSQASFFEKILPRHEVEIFLKTRQGLSLMSHLVHVLLFSIKKVMQLVDKHFPDFDDQFPGVSSPCCSNLYTR